MTVVKCPNCKKPVEWSDKSTFRPFCSERCRVIDLGGWADGSYAIPTDTPVEDAELEGSGDSNNSDTDQDDSKS